MSENAEPQFLYLTTRGRKSGKPHQIEIWFVHHGDCYYLVSEQSGKEDWVKNVQASPAISFSLGSRDAEVFTGVGRVVDAVSESELTASVKALMDAKYQWSDGLIVELKPQNIRR
jgi:deazaflavin-dependent oxidoreductase (nitroreductase family)